MTEQTPVRSGGVGGDEELARAEGRETGDGRMPGELEDGEQGWGGRGEKGGGEWTLGQRHALMQDRRDRGRRVLERRRLYCTHELRAGI